jgi:phospholipid/cholesterol/gamma-HCH transport system ATP-binding protein
MTILTGLKAPARGKVFYGKVDFWGGGPQIRDRIMRRAGVMYQSGALWSSMTLAENVALPLETYTDLSPKRIREVAQLKLALVGMAGFEEFYPSEISGGMQKRAGIARAWPWTRRSCSLMSPLPA